MDQSVRPLLIPPEFALYAEKHSIFELYQRLLSKLIIHKPEEPIQFIIDLIKKDMDASAVIVIGPPASGKKSLARLLVRKTGACLLNRTNVIDKAPNALRNELKKEIDEKKLKPTSWAKLFKNRIDDIDCVRKGWVLEDYPETRAQALALVSAGVLPKHTVVLQGSDSMLIERAAGKKIDPKTGDIYHTTFDWPTDASIQQRLVTPNNYTEEDLVNRIITYNRHIGGVMDCLKATAKLINVDQPKGDVFNQIIDFVSRNARSYAPTTPRILLIGPYGSGRRTQANALAKKYDIVNVSMSQLIKYAVANESTLGIAIRPHLQRRQPVPDSLLMPLLKERLGQLDCVSRGWVLHGFPRTRQQAEALERSGFTPNRVFFIDIPRDSILERTTLRYLDPITGERYHMLNNPPPTIDIRDRLMQKSSDTESVVSARIGEYFANVKELLGHYENFALKINGDQDANTVLESIESGLVNPLPNVTETMTKE